MTDFLYLCYFVILHLLLVALLVYVLQLRYRLKQRHTVQTSTFSQVQDPAQNDSQITSSTPQTSEAWRDKVSSLISQHLHQTGLHTGDIAQMLYMSKRSFQRRFKAEFEMTFGSYLMMVRMTSAKALLQESLLVSEVAARCGYSDLSYFCFCFKQYYGVSPSHYLPQRPHQLTQRHNNKPDDR
ncbi:helix-turn-helix transcriptional regulator [Vibrio hippocampi]|uniref:HTH-type transcriptional activator RhaR n=1 Tax=Vibrio hippocampi TaxID=654686 RepID=A0ABN8DHH5_9VIBR|nr:helix-turn-helix transcriptional regulator [Vibrio hippocampi]CAH0525119.1 HTH-type transcriptional activator RhaR [Vibrio hippocampi]